MKRDVVDKLAGEMFERDHPGRPWRPEFVKRGSGPDAQVNPATEEERERYTKLAEEKLPEQELKDDGDPA
ncbi:MAG: hypothetical protein C0458_05550 [Methylobacterium sp.]|nr:hypothetical protein [Methylobacterium sp.]